MLPDHVKIILLSATVPNTKEFADWVGCDLSVFMIYIYVDHIPDERKRKISMSFLPRSDLCLLNIFYMLDETCIKLWMQTGNLILRGNLHFFHT